jgi:3',5'-cyclic AMP phosphodiesterase CpdA
MLIAQITDLHIGFDRDNPHELNVRRLNMVVDQIDALCPRPELLIVSGDLVEHGDDTHAYDHVHALIGRWQGPMLLAVGNHDGRANFAAEFPGVERDPNGFFQYEAEFGSLRILVLDTLEEGRHGGAFCELRAAWLVDRAGRVSSLTGNGSGPPRSGAVERAASTARWASGLLRTRTTPRAPRRRPRSAR